MIILLLLFVTRPKDCVHYKNGKCTLRFSNNFTNKDVSELESRVTSEGTGSSSFYSFPAPLFRCFLCWTTHTAHRLPAATHVQVFVKFVQKRALHHDGHWSRDEAGHRVPTELLLYRTNQHTSFPEFIHDYEDEDLLYIVVEPHGLPKPRESFFGAAYYDVNWNLFFE